MFGPYFNRTHDFDNMEQRLRRRIAHARLEAYEAMNSPPPRPPAGWDDLLRQASLRRLVARQLPVMEAARQDWIEAEKAHAIRSGSEK